MELANALLTVMRGTRVDDAGGIDDTGIPIYQHVPGALVEKSHVTFDPASQTRRTIRTWMCVLPAWADVDTDDTIMCETTTPPTFFYVRDIQRQPSIDVPADLILTLEMRSGISVTSG